MAFTPSTLGVIVQPIGSDGMRFINYRTDDDVAVVTGTDYFEKASSFGIRAHDLIFVSPLSTSIEPYILMVDAVDADGNATASIGDYDEKAKTAMQPSVYDPHAKGADAFDQDNMSDGTTNKNYTATEKTKLADAIVASNNLSDVADVAQARGNMSVPKYVDDKAALQALDPSKDKSALAGNRKFVFDGSDLSATLVKASVTTTSVDSSTDTCTAAGHGLFALMPVVVSAAVNGLSLNTIYYLIVPSTSTFKFATSEANAAAGTAIDLTGTTNFTIKVLNDPDQDDWVIKGGQALDGSQGVWVGDEAGAPQGTAVTGASYLRRTTAFKNGSPMLPEYFGCAAGTSDTVIQKNTTGLNDALAQPYKLHVPAGADHRVGPLVLNIGGVTDISGSGTIRASSTGQNLFNANSVVGLRLRDVSFQHASATGQTSGSSTDGGVTLTDCIGARVASIKSNMGRYIGLYVLRGSDNRVRNCDLSNNFSPIQFRAVKGGEISGCLVDGSILTGPTFKTGIHLVSTFGHTDGLCEDVDVFGNLVKSLGNAQGFLAHAGKRCKFWANKSIANAAGFAFASTSSATDDDIDDFWISGNFVDGLTGLSAAQITAAYGYFLAGLPTNLAMRNVLIGNTGVNINTEKQDTGSGGVYVTNSQDTNVEANILNTIYGAGFLDVDKNTNLQFLMNVARTITGASGGKGFGYRLLAASGNPSDNTRIVGGTVEDAATGVRNEAANATGTVYVDPSITMKTVTTPTSGFGGGFGANVKTITGGTDADLSNCDTIVFSAGSSHTISTVSNAVPNKEYTVVFTNGNTTISSTGTTIYTIGGTDILGSNRMTVKFKAAGASELRQMGPASATS